MRTYLSCITVAEDTLCVSVIHDRVVLSATSRGPFYLDFDAANKLARIVHDASEACYLNDRTMRERYLRARAVRP